MKNIKEMSSNYIVNKKTKYCLELFDINNVQRVIANKMSGVVWKDIWEIQKSIEQELNEKYY